MKIDKIVEAVRSLPGIEELNLMQKYMVDHALDPATMLLAPTGSGKTLAFTMPILVAAGEPSAVPAQHPKCVAIAPARELVIQIAGVIRSVAPGFKTVALYGGHDMREEQRSLEAGADIVAATPGRFLDHLNRGSLEMRDPAILVLDEWDKILELGFADEVRRICRRLGHPARIVLTSATDAVELPGYLPARRQFVTADFRDDPAGGVQAPRLEVVRVESPAADKLDTLRDLLLCVGGGRSIVFVNHRESAERVYKALRKQSFHVALYHGGLDQRERELALDLLDNGTVTALVATDLGARGLDIAGVENVIHYHLPLSVEAWTHRNGRTARAGASGTVYAIVSDADNVPGFMEFDRPYFPKPTTDIPVSPKMASLYFDSGRKEKISRGDIAGFLIARGGLRADEVGKIVVKDHSAVAAVPAERLREVAVAVAPFKLKNKRVRITPLS